MSILYKNLKMCFEITGKERLILKHTLCSGFFSCDSIVSRWTARGGSLLIM